MFAVELIWWASSASWVLASPSWNFKNYIKPIVSQCIVPFNVKIVNVLNKLTVIFLSFFSQQ